MGYFTSIVGVWRHLATYVDKVLKGANPADLPVAPPIKFELIVNLKTADALGLIVPPSLLARADDGASGDRHSVLRSAPGDPCRARGQAPAGVHVGQPGCHG